MIKAVFFDLDDTLYDSTGFSQRLRKESLASMIRAGLPAKSVSEAQKVLEAIIKKYGSNNERHFNYLCKHYRVADSSPIIAAGVVTYHNLKVSLQPFPQTVPVLLGLVKQGVKLALITNGVPVKQWDKILRLQIKDYFEMVLVAKPTNTNGKKTGRIRKALKTFGITADEAAYVGDKLDADIASANRVGVHSIRLLHGKHKELSPRSRLEHPIATIRSLSQLPSVLSKL